MRSYAYLFAAMMTLLIAATVTLSTSRAATVLAGIAAWVAVQPVIVAEAKRVKLRA